MAKEWYLSTSDDYLSGFENEEFSLNATSAFDEILTSSPESYDVLINGMPNKAIIQKGNVDDKRTILTRIGELHCGDVVSYKSNQWLVYKFADDNKMHQSSEMRLCNASFPIQTDKIQVLVGKDQFGRPIYEEREGASLYEPCIVETKLLNQSENTAIPLPDDVIVVTMRYQESHKLELNKVFKMYGTDYKIMNIDYTKVINGKGIVTLSARFVKEDGS